MMRVWVTDAYVSGKFDAEDVVVKTLPALDSLVWLPKQERWVRVVNLTPLYRRGQVVIPAMEVDEETGAMATELFDRVVIG